MSNFRIDNSWEGSSALQSQESDRSSSVLRNTNSSSCYRFLPLVAGVAHKFKNPLSFIESNLFYIKEYTQDLIHFAEICQNRALPHHKIAPQPRPLIVTFFATIYPRYWHLFKRILQALSTFSRLDESE